MILAVGHPHNAYLGALARHGNSRFASAVRLFVQSGGAFRRIEALQPALSPTSCGV